MTEINHPKFIIKQSIGKAFWYFLLTAKNGQVILQSEMYKSKSSVKRGIARVKLIAEDAAIEEEEQV